MTRFSFLIAILERCLWLSCSPRFRNRGSRGQLESPDWPEAAGPSPSQCEFSVLVATPRRGYLFLVRALLLRRTRAHNQSARLPAK